MTVPPELHASERLNGRWCPPSKGKTPDHAKSYPYGQESFEHIKSLALCSLWDLSYRCHFSASSVVISLPTDVVEFLLQCEPVYRGMG